MIVPGRAAIVTACALAPLTLFALVDTTAIAAVAVANLLLVATCLFIGSHLKRQPIRVEREDWSRAEIDVETEFVYRIHNAGRKRVTVSIRQRWPASFRSASDSISVTLEPMETVRAAVVVTPNERGQIAIEPAEVDVRFALDLARWRATLDDGAKVAVHPNMRAVADYEALRRHRALGQLGIHRMRLIGAGREFDQLREYAHDDDYRDIDWKATARRRSPITMVYRAERSQDVVVCIDRGRMMGNPIGERTALDCAVDAATLLVHVCNQSGDRAGLVLFGDRVDEFIKPASGVTATRRIVKALIDASPLGVFPSYTELVASLRVNQKRRAMVFLFTDLNDPQLAMNMTQVMGLVSRRHLVVVVSLRDPMLDRVAGGATTQRRGIYQIMAARALADERDARVRQLIRAGVQVLEADATTLSIDVINKYLSVKARQLV